MAESTLRTACVLGRLRNVAVEVRYDGGDGRALRQWLGAGQVYRRQGSGDLGDRMHDAFQDGLRRGAKRMVVIGTDCPELTPRIVGDAFDGLAENDLVLGPAEDGGYYLIGLSRPTRALFEGISWGTSQVLDSTLEVARGLGLSVALLPRLGDVDRPEDLHLWDRARRGLHTPRISVVVAALNEAGNIGASLASTRTGLNVQLIVVDGGSDDGTAEIAESAGATVLRCAPGRAVQLNTGASQASGDILLFLHADTRLPDGFDACIRYALSDSDVAAGAFLLGVDGASALVRGLVEPAANWRSRRRGMPYGDQAIFLKARVFHEAGGFPEMPIMEDFELMKRLRRRGRIEILPLRVATSGRRWRRLGVLRTTLINRAIITAYALGVAPSRLATWYRR